MSVKLRCIIIEQGRSLCRGVSGGGDYWLAARRVVETRMGRFAFGRGATRRTGASRNNEGSEACKSMFETAIDGRTEEIAFTVSAD